MTVLVGHVPGCPIWWWWSPWSLAQSPERRIQGMAASAEPPVGSDWCKGRPGSASAGWEEWEACVRKKRQGGLPSREVHRSRETRAENQEGYMGAMWAWRRELGCPGNGLWDRDLMARCFLRSMLSINTCRERESLNSGVVNVGSAYPARRSGLAFQSCPPPWPLAVAVPRKRAWLRARQLSLAEGTSYKGIQPSAMSNKQLSTAGGVSVSVLQVDPCITAGVGKEMELGLLSQRSSQRQRGLFKEQSVLPCLVWQWEMEQGWCVGARPQG